jgi:RNA polymerase sigma factor for flagellar operon FliA
MHIRADMAEEQNLQKRNRLVERYCSYVDTLAKLLIRQMRLPPERHDELVAAGYLGLVEAAERYDSQRKTHFKSYAFFRIRGAMVDSMRDDSELSRQAYRYARAVSAASELRQSQEEVRGERSERSSSTGERLAGILDYLSESALVFRLSMAETNVDLQSAYNAPENPEVLAMRHQESAWLQNLLQALPQKERTIVQAYYFRGLSFNEIADEMGGVSKSWVSRLHTRAIEMLQELVRDGHA